MNSDIQEQLAGFAPGYSEAATGTVGRLEPLTHLMWLMSVNLVHFDRIAINIQ